mgnify:FL=1
MKRKSFTLVELLIYMGLFTILLIVLTDIFSGIFDIRRESESLTSVELDGNYVTAKLLYDIPQAQSFSTPSTEGVQTTSLIMTINGEIHTYALNSGDLQLTNNSGTFQLNSEGTTISNLTFQKIGPGPGKDTLVINYDVTSTPTRKRVREVKNYPTASKLRCETLTC